MNARAVQSHFLTELGVAIDENIDERAEAADWSCWFRFRVLRRIARDAAAAFDGWRRRAYSAEQLDREALIELKALVAGLEDGKVDPSDWKRIKRITALVSRSADRDHDLAEASL